MSTTLSSSKNFYLLIALLVYFLMSPFVIDRDVANVSLTLIMSAIILTCVNLVKPGRLTLYTSIGLAVLNIIIYCIIVLADATRPWYIAHFLMNAIFMVIMTLFVITAIMRHEPITIDTLLGAINGYLLIGLCWSYFDLTMACINPNAFSYRLISGTLRDDVQHFIYFSYVTLTSVGYGDIVPRTDIARTFSWLEAATGQIYLTVWISQLVAEHISQRIRKREHLKP